MEQIKIDLVPNGVMSVAHASQFDVGRSMKFLLTDEGVTYTLAGTEVITMKLRKPDGTDDTISLVNTSSSYVEWTTVDGDLDLSGVYLAEITITSGDDVLGTANFLLKVEADPYNGKNIRIVTVGPADICTFETTLPEPYQSVTVNVLATGGNGTTDNPNPINGYTSANITRCGVNLFDSNKFVSNYSARYEMGTDGCVKQISTANIADVLWNNSFGQTGAFSIVFRVKYASAGTTGVRPCINYTDGTKWYVYPTNTQDYAEYIVLTNSSKTVKDITTDFGTANNMTSFFLQVAVGENTTYHPYTGNTYTIAFGQTVYGGVLDVTRGKLHVTKKIVDLGDYTYSKELSRGHYHYYSQQIADIKGYTFYEVGDLLCTDYPCISRDTLYNGNLGVTVDDTRRAYVYNSDWDNESTTGADVQTTLDGVKLLCELATPFDIDLTPVQIRALVGENNVFADCGETEVEYLDEE